MSLAVPSANLAPKPVVKFGLQEDERSAQELKRQQAYANANHAAHEGAPAHLASREFADLAIGGTVRAHLQPHFRPSSWRSCCSRTSALTAPHCLKCTIPWASMKNVSGTPLTPKSSASRPSGSSRL